METPYVHVTKCNILSRCLNRLKLLNIVVVTINVRLNILIYIIVRTVWKILQFRMKFQRWE